MKVLNQDYDVVIVGSGPGGATVAKELTENNKKVLILEMGNNAPIKGTLLQTLPMLALPGKSAFITDKKGTLLFRGVTTGGSSVFYCGTAFDPPFEMLESYGVDIRNEINELKSELPIKPLSDELTGPMAKKISDSARDLGYGWEKINKFIFQDKCKPDCWKCSYGCPYDAKWNARNYVEQAVANGARLVNGAKVDKVLFEGKKATGVEFAIGRKNYTVEAPKVIISAGGIGTSSILRHSGIYNAGYNFFFDPLVLALGSVKGVKRGRELMMAAGMHVQDKYVMTDLALPNWPQLSIMVKVKDDLGGRVTYNGGTRKEITPEDRKKLNEGFAHAKKILKNAGAKTVIKTITIAAHPGGTARIGDVVDSNLKTEYDDLYVCDCSVIPEAWGLPPSLTILGLGKRLAKHLLN